VSSNLPEYQGEASPLNSGPCITGSPSRGQSPTSREWLIAAGLIGITIFTTTVAGVFYNLGDLFLALQILLSKPSAIIYGLPFSIPLITILLSHELGHYIACRYYGMRCTPPFFIPAPIPLTGTFGAFIKIKSQFVHKRGLFDIGIAGPLAGFVFTLPTLWIGIALSKIVPKQAIAHGGYYFGEPLIFKISGVFILGYHPGRQELIAHPMAMAAWVGLLATSLNLLPIWQLDGGHITYAMIGRSLHRKVSVLVLIGLLVLGFWGVSYLAFCVLLLIFGTRARFYHPPTLNDEENLGFGRTVLGLLALLILIICFIPIPITGY
jgi:membrane-associated protease RseP (regulator of RpoE activity)